MNLQPDDIPACAAAYLQIALKALDLGMKLAPGTIQTHLAEDLQTVLVTVDLNEDELIGTSFKLSAPTTEAKFYARK